MPWRSKGRNKSLELELKNTCLTEKNKRVHIWVFPKIAGTPKWMVYDGKPYENGWFGGTIIFGNTHLFPANWVNKWDNVKKTSFLSYQLMSQKHFFYLLNTTTTASLELHHGPPMAMPSDPTIQKCPQRVSDPPIRNWAVEVVVVWNVWKQQIYTISSMGMVYGNPHGWLIFMVYVGKYSIDAMG